MPRNRGGYLGGSTIISATGSGYSYDPHVPDKTVISGPLHRNKAAAQDIARRRAARKLAKRPPAKKSDNA